MSSRRQPKFDGEPIVPDELPEELIDKAVEDAAIEVDERSDKAWESLFDWYKKKSKSKR